MNELEDAIAGTFINGTGDLAKRFAEIKVAGGTKSRCVQIIKQATRSNEFMRSGLLLMLDKIWEGENGN